MVLTSGKIGRILSIGCQERTLLKKAHTKRILREGENISNDVMYVNCVYARLFKSATPVG